MPKGIKSGESIKIAYGQAAAQVKAADPKEVCRRANVRYENDRYEFTWFGMDVSVGIPAIDFEPKDVPEWQQLLILHYLAATSPKAPSGEMVGFKEIEGAMFYYDAFKRRGLSKIVSMFGENPTKLVEAGKKLGGEPMDLGDGAIKFRVLPSIEAAAIINAADEEFPAEANIVFSDTVGTYLPVEDIAILGDIIASKLKRSMEE